MTEKYNRMLYIYLPFVVIVVVRVLVLGAVKKINCTQEALSVLFCVLAFFANFLFLWTEFTLAYRRYNENILNIHQNTVVSKTVKKIKWSSGHENVTIILC